MLADDLVRVRHMLDSAREAVVFAAGRASGEIMENRMLALALVRCIEIVGEAASKVGPELRGRYPAVRGTDIIAMRNRLVHAYFDIDLDRVCYTLSNNLPPLIVELERLLTIESDPEDRV